jgi:hypothetical protein
MEARTARKLSRIADLEISIQLRTGEPHKQIFVGIGHSIPTVPFFDALNRS